MRPRLLFASLLAFQASLAAEEPDWKAGGSAFVRASHVQAEPQKLIAVPDLPKVEAVTKAPALPQPQSAPVPDTPPPRSVAAQPDVPHRSISMAGAVLLANNQAIDSQLADQYVNQAAAVYARSRVLWLPTLNVGTDWYYHTGSFQNFQGEILKNNRRSFMYGAGVNAVFGLGDAWYAPRAARNELNASEARRVAVRNDLSLQVIDAYIAVLQYQGESESALVIVKDAEEVVRRTEALAEGLAPGVEANRARVELARRKQAYATARERQAVANAELARLLRVDSRMPLVPVEPWNVMVQLIDPNSGVDDLIPIALTHRPELAQHQSIVQATLERLKAERQRPLVPSILLRSVSTNPSGSLGIGSFGGGRSNVGDFGGRFDYDLQVMWELQNLGLGNRARANERKAEHAAALLELFRTQDRIAAEVVAAYAQLIASIEKVAAAEPAFAESQELLKASVEGMMQTRKVGNLVTLVVRPQEVVASLQALGQSNSDYFAAIAEYNRAQFRLFRALGHPVGALIEALK